MTGTAFAVDPTVFPRCLSAGLLHPKSKGDVWSQQAEQDPGQELIAMRHATPSNKNSDAAREACMEDVVAVLFADENAFASFAAWIDADLERLEARFAQYSTYDSLTSSPRRKRK